MSGVCGISSRLAHLEAQSGTGHATVSSIAVREDSHIVALSGRKGVDVGLKFLSNWHDGIIGCDHVLIRFPNANL